MKFYTIYRINWEGFSLWDHIGGGGNCLPDPNHAPRYQDYPAIPAQTLKVAREIITLDHLSHGRVILGVGLGDLVNKDFKPFGEISKPRCSHLISLSGWPHTGPSSARCSEQPVGMGCCRGNLVDRRNLHWPGNAKADSAAHLCRPATLIALYQTCSILTAAIYPCNGKTIPTLVPSKKLVGKVLLAQEIFKKIP